MVLNRTESKDHLVMASDKVINFGGEHIKNGSWPLSPSALIVTNEWTVLDCEALVSLKGM